MQADEATFSLRVYPSPEWKSFSVTPKHSGAHSGMGVIDLAKIRQYAQSVHGLKNDNLLYYVNIVPDETKNLSLTRRLGAALSNTGVRKFTVPAKDYKSSHILMIAAPREVARANYRLSTLPTGIDYSIDIFDGSEEQRAQLKAFHRDVKATNKELYAPLWFVVPVRMRHLVSPDRIVFVARRERVVIGYCACTILPFRTEKSEELNALMDEILSSDKDILDRYFMNVRPRSSYEIEGLAAHKRESGKHVGRLLLYEALRFIRDERIKQLYPVTHVISQAASYITKYLLITDYGFRYHGPNQFLNESFVETLSNETTKPRLISVLKQIVDYYYVILFDDDHMRKLKTVIDTLTASDSDREIAFNMLNMIIHTYQLYFLLLQTTAQVRALDVDNAEIQASLIRLFELLMNMLAARPHATLKDYFRRNIAAIKQYATDVARTQYTAQVVSDALNRILTELYTKHTDPTRPKLKEAYRQYGFMFGEEKGVPKKPFRQGYDVVYTAMNNMAKLNLFLDAEARLELCFDTINKLVLSDVTLRFNYEIPTEPRRGIDQIRADQLLLISKQLTLLQGKFARKTLFPTRVAEIRHTIAEIKKKELLIVNNYRVNKQLSIDFYTIPFDLTEGCDTIISLKTLEDNWSNIHATIVKKTTRVDTPSILPPPVIVSIPMPTNRDDLFRDISRLGELLYTKPRNQNTLVEFNNAKYYTVDLTQHFIKLMGLRDTFGILLSPNMEVEGDDDGDAEGVTIYELSDFADDDLDLGQADDSMVMNQTLI